MSIFKVCVERSEIVKEFFEIEAETLEDAIDTASGGEVKPDANEYIYGEVLDSGEIQEEETDG